MLFHVVTYSAARAYVVFSTPMTPENFMYTCAQMSVRLNPPYLSSLPSKIRPKQGQEDYVDRPEFVDENRENDFLQRLAICAETPEDQIQDLIYEVDTWLDTRADDTVCTVSCLILYSL